MTFPAPRLIVSGRPYVVVGVGGRRPARLSDFAGQTTLLLDLHGEDYVVHGFGIEGEGLVRVFEKGDQGHGKDIRVWHVRQEPDAETFTAEHSVS